MKNYVDATALQEYTTKLVAKLKTLFPGTPTAAETVADMTDHSKTYVYVGTESGYTAGDWYYWDGSAWTSGGPFQATSIITDTTLAVAGEAADAKATGDAIAAAKMAVLNAMASAYSPYETYAVGVYVNQNGAIYRCTTPITTAEAWTAGHWAAVTLGADLEGQVSDLKTQFDDTIGIPGINITDISGYEPINGFIDNQNVWRYINNNYQHVIIPIERTGGNYNIKAADDHTAYFAFLSGYVTPSEIGELPSFCSSPYNVRQPITSGRNATGTVPGDAKYLYVAVKSNGTDISPSAFNLTIPGIQGSLTAQMTEIEDSLLSDNILYFGSWEMGTVNAASGSIASSTESIVTTNPIDISEGIAKLFTDDSHKFRVYGWDSNGYQGFWTGDSYTTSGSAIPYVYSEISIQPLLTAGTQKVRIVLVRTDNTNITVADGNAFQYEANSSWINRKSIESIQASLNTVASPYNHGIFMINRCDYSAWYSGLQLVYGGFGRDTMYSEVISAFDDLQQSYSTYITKNALGTASGTDGSGNPYTVYEYVFKPNLITNALCTEKMPCIYMDGSIHGFEKSSTYGLYYLMKDICDNWDKNESLKNARSCVEFHIIPVVNPWGFDNYSYYNANDVNINRNFDSKYWAANPEDHTGDAPFDQPESVIVRDWLINGRDNILMYFNGHTNGAVVSSTTEMNVCITRGDGDEYYNKMIKVFCDHIDKQTVVIPKMYPEIGAIMSQNEMCGKIALRYDDSSKIGTASAWAMAYAKLLAMTLETFNGIWLDPKYQSTEILAPYSSDALKLNSEIIGNLVLQILSEYAPH